MAGGRETRWGAVVRADALDRLTATGWSALKAYGVRTIIDLRNDDERGPDVAPRPTEPGGVVVHCGIGRDRTGLITLLLLALAGVAAEDIAADYEREATSARDVITSLLASLDVVAYLRGGGLGDEALAALHARVIGSETDVRPP